jgi:hypothetical protein
MASEQSFRANGRRYKLRDPRSGPKPDRARSRFARGIRRAEMRERTQHSRLSLRKMVPVMRTHDPELVRIRTQKKL